MGQTVEQVNEEVAEQYKDIGKDQDNGYLYQKVVDEFEHAKLRALITELQTANGRILAIPETNPQKFSQEKLKEMLKQRDLYKDLYVTQSIRNKEKVTESQQI